MLNFEFSRNVTLLQNMSQIGVLIAIPNYYVAQSVSKL